MAQDAQFNACDYERAFMDFCKAGRFEVARLTLIKAKQLRETGDTSEEPSGPTAEDCQNLADEFVAAAASCLLKANVARVMAEMIREEEL